MGPGELPSAYGQAILAHHFFVLNKSDMIPSEHPIHEGSRVNFTCRDMPS